MGFKVQWAYRENSDAGPGGHGGPSASPPHVQSPPNPSRLFPRGVPSPARTALGHHALLEPGLVLPQRPVQPTRCRWHLKLWAQPMQPDKVQAKSLNGIQASRKYRGGWASAIEAGPPHLKSEALYSTKSQYTQRHIAGKAFQTAKLLCSNALCCDSGFSYNTWTTG